MPDPPLHDENAALRLCFRLRDGEATAEILCQEHVVTWYVMQLARDFSISDAEDAYQEAVMALIQLVDSGDLTPENPLGLVYCIARRKAIDLVRRTASKRSVSVESTGDVGTESSSDAAASLERRDECEKAISFIQLLPPAQQQVLKAMVHYIFNYNRVPSNKELAAQLGRTEAAIKRSRFLALAKLREFMQSGPANDEFQQR